MGLGWWCIGEGVGGSERFLWWVLRLFRKRYSRKEGAPSGHVTTTDSVINLAVNGPMR